MLQVLFLGSLFRPIDVQSQDEDENQDTKTENAKQMNGFTNGTPQKMKTNLTVRVHIVSRLSTHSYITRIQPDSNKERLKSRVTEL